MQTYLDGVAELLAVVALNLGPVLGLGAVLGKVTDLLAIAALLLIRVAGLRALLGHVVFGITVAAGALGDVGALSNVKKNPRKAGTILTSLEKWPVSLHLRHSTFSDERGSGHSFELWPSCLQFLHAKGLMRSLGQSRAR